MNNKITVKQAFLIYIIVAALLFCLFTSNISIAEAKKKHQQKSDDTKVNAAKPAGNQNDCAAPCGTPFPPGETAATVPQDENPPTPAPPPTTIPPIIIGDDRGGHHSSQSGSKGKSLAQVLSKPTDFPNNDVNAIQVYVTSTNKDIIGAYHVRGEIKNLSNDTTLQFVKVTAHLYDGSGQPVAVTTCCYADPHDIEPGHTSTFDSFAQEEVISGTPTSYRLSFNWR